MIVIETHKLRKEFRGRPAVKSLDLEVCVGEIYGFLGPQGAGKTTTIRMLTGILPPSGGEAIIAGHDLRTDPEKVRTNSGLLPESVGYYGWMTAAECLLFFADLYGMHRADSRRRVAALLASVGLAAKSTTPIAGFSRGMRARLGIARALVHRPRVVFLDEPLWGLEPPEQRDILDLIRGVNRDEGATIFLSSRVLNQAGQVCTRVGIVNEGRLVAQGTASDLSHRLALPLVLRLTVADAVRARQVAEKLELYDGSEVPDPAHLVLVPRGSDVHADRLVRALVSAGIPIREVTSGAPSLEEMFAALVRRERSRA